MTDSKDEITITIAHLRALAEIGRWQVPAEDEETLERSLGRMVAQLQRLMNVDAGQEAPAGKVPGKWN